MSKAEVLDEIFMENFSDNDIDCLLYFFHWRYDSDVIMAVAVFGAGDSVRGVSEYDDEWIAGYSFPVSASGGLSGYPCGG